MPVRCLLRGRPRTKLIPRPLRFYILEDRLPRTPFRSLVIERSSAPAELEVSAETDDGVIMGVQHRDRPTFGVQFHPESIASEHGRQILRNFLDLAEVFHQRQPPF